MGHHTQLDSHADLELLILLHHVTLLSSSIALGFGEGETVYYYIALADLEFIM